MLLLARLSPITNSALNTVFIFTSSLYNVSHSFEHCTTGVFQKLSRFDVISVNHCISDYDFRTQYWSLQTSLSPRHCWPFHVYSYNIHSIVFYCVQIGTYYTVKSKTWFLQLKNWFLQLEQNDPSIASWYSVTCFRVAYICPTCKSAKLIMQLLRYCSLYWGYENGYRRPLVSIRFFV